MLTATVERPCPRAPGRDLGCGGGGFKMSKINSSWFTSETDEWPTPQRVFDVLNWEFRFTLDPCATPENAKCERFYTRLDNGLLKSWSGEVVFMNPPYGEEIGTWMAKAHGAATQDGATVVCLVPARTDTAWWHDYAMKHEVRLIRGRLKYGDGKESAPFPSAIIVMRPTSFRLVSCNDYATPVILNAEVQR
jgi:phage N-6-adenine-methyltransferase